MIRTMLRFETDPEQSETVVKRVIESGLFEAAVELTGAISCEMLQDTNSPGSFVMLALWENEEAYAAWRNHPSRDEIGGTINDLDLVMTGSVYEIRTRVPAGDASS